MWPSLQTDPIASGDLCGSLHKWTYIVVST